MTTEPQADIPFDQPDMSVLDRRAFLGWALKGAAAGAATVALGACGVEAGGRGRVDVACVDAETSSASTESFATQLPGSEMRQDLYEAEPGLETYRSLFRAATVSIASENGYGSGGLFRNPETGQLTLRTVRHVYELIAESPDGLITFPGASDQETGGAFWRISGCDLEPLTTEQFHESHDFWTNDSITEIVLPDNVVRGLEPHIAAGKITPIEGGHLIGEHYDWVAQQVRENGMYLIAPRADTGEWNKFFINLEGIIIEQSNGTSIRINGFEPEADYMHTYPFVDQSGQRVVDNACAGDSGVPGFFYIPGVGIPPEAPGAVGMMTAVVAYGDDAEGLRDDAACSPVTGLLTFNRKE